MELNSKKVIEKKKKELTVKSINCCVNDILRKKLVNLSVCGTFVKYMICPKKKIQNQCETNKHTRRSQRDKEKLKGIYIYIYTYMLEREKGVCVSTKSVREARDRGAVKSVKRNAIVFDIPVGSIEGF